MTLVALAIAESVQLPWVHKLPSQVLTIHSGSESVEVIESKERRGEW